VLQKQITKQHCLFSKIFFLYLDCILVGKWTKKRKILCKL